MSNVFHGSQHRSNIKRRPYGLILDSQRNGIMRALLEGNDRVVVQTLTIYREDTMTLADLMELMEDMLLVERADAGDPVLEKLARGEALKTTKEGH
jgi:hypothetical protein